MKYKFVRSNNTDIYWNFALEEYMLDKVTDDDFILYLWRNTPSVLIGRNQNVYAECNLKTMEEDNVKFVRRMSGGGTVYFDLGNVTYSFIATKKNFSKEKNYKLIINSLNKLGFVTEQSGRNDILYDDKKISGNAFYYTERKSLHHGTILLNVDMSNMAKYLNVSKKKLEAKGVQSVRARVVNLIEYNPNLTYEKIVEAFYEQYCELAGEKIHITTLEDIQKEQESHKYYNKHTSKEWQFGRNPEFNQSFEDRFDWGNIEFRLYVKDNKIKDASVFSDSLCPEFFSQINKALINTEYNKHSIVDTINNINYSKIPENELENIGKIKENIFELIAKHL